jgi:hypothetical protein
MAKWRQHVKVLVPENVTEAHHDLIRMMIRCCIVRGGDGMDIAHQTDITDIEEQVAFAWKIIMEDRLATIEIGKRWRIVPTQKAIDRWPDMIVPELPN